MESTPSTEPSARPAPGAPSGLTRYTRPALIAGIVIVAVSLVLLLVVMGLDAFMATVYSVDGKSINDATEEAIALRGQYAGAKAAAVVGLVVGGIAVVASTAAMYFTRGSAANDDGDDLSYDELTSAGLAEGDDEDQSATDGTDEARGR